MKTRSSFLKKKKNLIIAIWLLISIVISTTLVILFLKQDDSSNAAEIEKNLANGSNSQTESNNNESSEILNNENKSNDNNEENNIQSANSDITNVNNENINIMNQNNVNNNANNNVNNNDNNNANNNANNITNNNVNNNVNNNTNTNTNNNANNNTNNNHNNNEDNNTNNNVELEETVTYEDKLISEDFLVGWTPISILGVVKSAERNLYTPQLEIEKHSYSEREFSFVNNKLELKESKNDYVFAGETILYEITVKNIGDRDVNNIRIYDSAPEQTTLKQVDSSTKIDEKGIMCWTVNIPKYTEVKVRFFVTVNENAKGTIRNTALVNAEETNETQNPIIEIKKEVAQTEPLYEGDSIDYTITVTNTGDIDTTVNVQDNLPTEITYVRDTANLGAELIEENGIQILKWNNILLSKGETKKFIFQGIVNELPNEVFNKEILNIAIVNDKQTNEVKNEVVKPNITREKKTSIDGNVHEGDRITYTIIAGNTGTGAKTIEIEDRAPEGTTFEKIENYEDLATPIIENGKTVGMKWNVELQPGDSKEFKFSVIVNNLPEGTYTKEIKNTALVDKIETNEVKNEVVKPYITREKKTSVDGNVHEGNTITYTIIAGNIGTEAKTIEIEDGVPEGTTFGRIESYEDLATTITDDNGNTIGVKWNITLLPGEINKEFKFSVTVNDLPEGTYTKEIKNTALVDKIETNEVKNKVVKPHITKLKSSVPASGTQVKFGEIITYIITVNNTGSCEKEVNIIDNIPANTEYVSAENNAQEIESNGKVTQVKWTDTIFPNKPKEFKFKVRVTGNVTETINNVAFVDDLPTNEITHKIVKTIQAEGRSTGKNIVVVLDLSSSMLKEPGSDEYPSSLISTSKLALAKSAVNTFVSNTLNENYGNTITLITYNYDTYENAKKGLQKCDADYRTAYWKRFENNNAVKPYIGVKVLAQKSSNETEIKNSVNNIKLEYPLLTNVYAGLAKTNEIVNQLKANEPNKDVAVVFIGDGKSSYSTEAAAYANTKGDTGCGFYTKEDTINNKIPNMAKEIKKKATIYTVEYAVPQKEKEDAKKIFEIISTNSSTRHEVADNVSTKTLDALNKELSKIATEIGKPETETQTTNANGIVRFTIPNKGNIFVSDKQKLIVEYGTQKIEISNLNELKNGKYSSQGIQYDATNRQLIIDATKFPADSNISVKYYYTK